MERIHRALRPKGRDTDPPRDVICCIVDYKLKEDILRQARGTPRLLHDRAPIQIFQDLSSITLQHRRDLKPLLETLRAEGIQYRWKFPFCLSASHLDRTALLKVPEDLHHFCRTLEIPMVEVPNWYADYCTYTPKRHTPTDDQMEVQDAGRTRRRSPSSSRPYSARHATHHGSSPTTSPRSRRTRRDH